VGSNGIFAGLANVGCAGGLGCLDCLGCVNGKGCVECVGPGSGARLRGVLADAADRAGPRTTPTTRTPPR
jgi:hypothetical protein